MALSDFSLNIVPLLKTLAAFLIWLTIAPVVYSFDRRKADGLEVFFRNLLQGIFFTAIIVYFLVVLRIFEFFSLLILYLIIWAMVLIISNKNPRKVIMDKTTIIIGEFFDWIEKPVSIKIRIKNIVQKWLGLITQYMKKLSALDIITLAVFAVIIGMRFYPRFSNLLAAPRAVMADPYVHLTWAKLMQSNFLFTDGVYPMGYHTLLSAIQAISHLDPYHVIRFIGPIGGSIIILGFYWLLLHISHNRVLALIGTAILGLSSHNGFPVAFFRQTLALPMEFSIALVFPGLVFLHKYLRGGDKRDLLLFGIATADLCLIHSYGALFLAIMSAMLIMTALLNRILTLKTIKELLIVGLTAGFIGFLPIVFGRLAGIPWHQLSISWISGSVNSGSLSNFLSNMIPLILGAPAYITGVSAATAVILLIASLYYCLQAKENTSLWPLTFLASSITCLFLFFGPVQGGFSLLVPERIELFLSMNLVACIIIAATLVTKPINSLINRPGKLHPAIKYPVRYSALFSVLAVCIIWLAIFPIRYYPKDEIFTSPVEYESAVKTYFRIKNDFPPLNWTTVAPVEQYEESLGYGYHYELWKFKYDFTIKHASNGNFDIPIPTQYILIYVEKIPLRIWVDVPVSVSSGPTGKYYRDAAGRAQLEREMLAWCKAYQQTHNNMTVYYEDKNLIVYLVEHDPLPYV